MSAPTISDVETTAFAAFSAGMAVLPPREDGTKAPMEGVAWRDFQQSRPPFDLVSRWYASGRHGVGLITGRTSGGREGFSLNVLDFDDGPTFGAFVELAASSGLADLLDRVAGGYSEETPSGGRHLLARVPGVWPSTKLAERPDPARANGRKTLIETKCEGGFIITAPSHGPVHDSGRPYTLLRGGLDSLAEVSAEEWTALCDLASTMDEMPAPEPEEPRPRPLGRAGEPGEAPGERWAAATSWQDLLAAHGWHLVFRRGDTAYWRRPGKSIGVSATTNHGGSDLFYCFSTSTSFLPRRSYTKFGALAHLEYGGDFHAAAKVLVEKGFGSAAPIPGRRPGPTRPNGDSSCTPGGSFVNSVNYVNGSQRSKDSRVTPWKPPRLKQIIQPTPFPLDVFPSSLAELCREGGRAIQCPVDYFGAGSIAMAGGAIGLSVDLAIKRGYHEFAAVYMAIVGSSGAKKTPVIIKYLAAPLYAIDRELRERYESDKAAHEERRRQYEADRKRDPACGPPPAPPVLRQLTLDDATREAVAQDHAENPRGLVLIKDELTSWVTSLDAYRAGKGDDRQFWLKINSGALVKVNRKGNREPVIVPQPCIAIVGGLTPAMLPAIRGGSHAEDGWIPRILFSYPPPMPASDWAEDEIPQELLDDWNAAIRKLWGRPMVQDPEGKTRPYTVQMDINARRLWVEWVNAHRAETRSQDFPEGLQGPWSKMEGFVLREALILAQLHQAYDSADVGPPRHVGALEMWGARKLADYHKNHFRRAMVDIVRRWDVPDDCTAALKWLSHVRLASFSERDIKRNFPGRFGSNPLALADCLEWLIERDCIRPVEAESGGAEVKPGRPHSPSYDVNPLLLGDVLDDPGSV